MPAGTPAHWVETLAEAAPATRQTLVAAVHGSVLNNLIDRDGAGGILDGDVKVVGSIDRETVRRGRDGCGGYRAAGACNSDQVRNAGVTADQGADAIVTTVRNVEAIGAVDRQAGRLVKTLRRRRGRRRIQRRIAGVALSTDSKTGNSRDVAGGVDLANAVVQSVGDELVPSVQRPYTTDC